MNVYKVPEMTVGAPEYDVDNVCYAAIEHAESNLDSRDRATLLVHVQQPRAREANREHGHLPAQDRQDQESARELTDEPAGSFAVSLD